MITDDGCSEIVTQLGAAFRQTAEHKRQLVPIEAVTSDDQTSTESKYGAYEAHSSNARRGIERLDREFTSAVWLKRSSSKVSPICQSNTCSTAQQ